MTTRANRDSPGGGSLVLNEITGEPLPAAEGEGEPVVFVVLSYAFRGQPDTLTFHPPTAGGEFPTANIGFITYHLGLPSMDFRYLGAESTIDLDWNDPWFSKFRNRNLWRQYDSPLNVFLYVEPYEVRVEIIARPRDVQKWTDVGVAGLHRLMPHLKRLTQCEALIVVAGMEGALPSVVGGYVACPVIAVPTSVGYGASFQGVAALLGMLNSCASNVTVVNIDNGFGAATVATLINRL